MPQRPAKHADWAGCGDGAPAAGYARGRADRASALEHFYQSLSDEQKARFNAIAPTDNRDAAAKDQRDLTKLCDEKTPGATDLPIDRIAQAVQPTPAQRPALDELKDASVKAAERLNADCPTYQTLTPTTGRGDGEAARHHARRRKNRLSPAREILQFAE